jgi:hypothetical protein
MKMTRILTNAFATSALASKFQTIVAIVHNFMPKAAASSLPSSENLSDRLRHDIGEIDVNPDMLRSGRNAGRSNTDREMMRRAF